MAFNDLIFNDKKIEDVLHKKVNKEFSDSNRTIFKEAKKLFDLRVEISKKLALEEENWRTCWRKSNIKNQGLNLSATSKQKEFNNVLQQIKEEQKNIDMNLFENIFDYETPDEILEYLHKYNQETSLIEESFKDFKDMVEAMSEGNEKNKGKKILNFVDRILNFTLKE